MKLLFDENLSPTLARIVKDFFPGSGHVNDLLSPGISDSYVWAFASQNDFAIVSKDNDFRQRSFMLGSPPKVVWLSVGNAGTTAIASLLRLRSTDLLNFDRDLDASLLVVNI